MKRRAHFSVVAGHHSLALSDRYKNASEGLQIMKQQAYNEATKIRNLRQATWIGIIDA